MNVKTNEKNAIEGIVTTSTRIKHFAEYVDGIE